jgi:predicted deacetylase
MQRLATPIVPGLIVSIHDVCPGSWERTEEMLADLAEVGVGRTSLLVIPNRHGKDPAFENPAFCEWLRDSRARGHELILHGYFHQRMSTRQHGWWGRMISRQYTAGEGEFYDLGREQAGELLERGRREMWAAVGGPIRGFIAPAWLLGGEVREVLVVDRVGGFDYTTTVGGVWDLAEGVFYPSQSLCYSVRSGWRRGCSLLWNQALLHWKESSPCVRIGLHPPDWDWPSVRSQILRLAESALAGRPAIPYDEWLQRQRSLS